MKLGNLLEQNRSAILQTWFDLILQTYPADASGFFKNQRDRFANPVGYTISHEMEALFTELLEGMDSDRISRSLDNIIRIRAVQDFSPSEAVHFVFLLKRAIGEKLGSEITKARIFDEMPALEERIDKLALLAFDIYMKCREQIHEIKINEVKKRLVKPLGKSDPTADEPADERAPDVDKIVDVFTMNRGNGK